MTTTINQRRALQIGISVGGLGAFLIFSNHWIALMVSVIITILAGVLRFSIYEIYGDSE